LVAGTNAAGGGAEFAGIAPTNRLKVVRLDVFSVGLFQPADGSYEVHEQERDGFWYRLVCRDGRIVGANLLGDTSLATALTEAIEKGIEIARLREFEDGAKIVEMCGHPHDVKV
jgi:nitrite reductase (NADH) large subunit